WDGEAADTGVYVRNLGEKDGKPDFLVLAVNCAHLGCPVQWFPEAGLFMCPCHGGVYYGNGEGRSGPPPRGPFKCVWTIARVKERDPYQVVVLVNTDGKDQELTLRSNEHTKKNPNAKELLLVQAPHYPTLQNTLREDDKTKE